MASTMLLNAMAGIHGDTNVERPWAAGEDVHEIGVIFQSTASLSDMAKGKYVDHRAE